MRGLAVRFALGWAFVVAVAACGAGDQPAPLPPPGAGGSAPGGTTAGGGPDSATGGPGGAPGTAVDRSDPVAVYRAWWGAVQAALATADAGYPDLATYAVDPLLTNTRRSLARLRGAGVVQVVTFELAPQVVVRVADRVEIADCIRTPPGTYRDAGTERPRAPTGFRNDIPTRDALRFVLRPRGGAWYLVASTALGGGPC